MQPNYRNKKTVYVSFTGHRDLKNTKAQLPPPLYHSLPCNTHTHTHTHTHTGGMTGDGRKEQSSIVPSPEVLNSEKEELFRLRAVRLRAESLQRYPREERS